MNVESLGTLDDIRRAIRQREASVLFRIMFEGKVPQVRDGFRTENELWDFKSDCPRVGREYIEEWAEIARDVLAFHNNQGGLIVFGIANDFRFAGAGPRLDSKLVNDALRKFVGDRIWVDFYRECIQENQRYLGLMLVPPRGPAIGRFVSDAPRGKREAIFNEGDSALREGDSSRIVRRAEADVLARRAALPAGGKVFEVDEPFYRLLARDYLSFVERAEPCVAVERALRDQRTAVASILGIGGAGKTALATWATLRAYERGDFDFIVSVTAKDRELTSVGIEGLRPQLTSFESLLDAILETLQFRDLKHLPVEQREAEVRGILANSNGLLYVDNLETVDDKRIVAFLDDLPDGVRAITTSRRTSVRVSVRPIDLGQLSDTEVVKFVGSLSQAAGFGHAGNFSEAECVRIGSACDRIPLAIRWALARSRSAGEALEMAADLMRSGRRGEELLEFSFRRVFSGLTREEQSVLQVVSLFNAPLPTEAILIGAGTGGLSANPRIIDAIEQLLDDALIQRVFDSELNDWSYGVLPITRAFVYAQVSKEPNIERGVRKRLTSWYEAEDVRDQGQRLLIRASRQGKVDGDSGLLDLALGYDRRGDLDAAEELFRQALNRSPKSWRAARLFGEFFRHRRHNVADALKLYEQAAANAPRAGSDRALIYREWGILLSASGSADATERASECLSVALEETPNDDVASTALAKLQIRSGRFKRAIDVLEPLSRSAHVKTRDIAINLLLKAYEGANELVKLAELRQIAVKLGVWTH